MSLVTINLDNGGAMLTVSEMRKRLARTLSGLNGDQLVAFSFTARLPEYQPRPLIEGVTVVHGELARPEND